MVIRVFSHFMSILVILGHSKSLKVILSHSKSFFFCKSRTRLIGVGLVGCNASIQKASRFQHVQFGDSNKKALKTNIGWSNKPIAAFICNVCNSISHQICICGLFCVTTRMIFTLCRKNLWISWICHEKILPSKSTIPKISSMIQGEDTDNLQTSYRQPTDNSQIGYSGQYFHKKNHNQTPL